MADILTLLSNSLMYLTLVYRISLVMHTVSVTSPSEKDSKMLEDILEIAMYLFLVIGVIWGYLWLVGKIIDWFSDINR